MVVRMRHTRSHTRNRRSHHALSAPSITASADGVAQRHRVSPVTGKYRGRQVVDVARKLDKKIAKKGKGSK
jgi:ribosomal protein L32